MIVSTKSWETMNFNQLDLMKMNLGDINEMGAQSASIMVFMCDKVLEIDKFSKCTITISC